MDIENPKLKRIVELQNKNNSSPLKVTGMRTSLVRFIYNIEFICNFKVEKFHDKSAMIINKYCMFIFKTFNGNFQALFR